MELITTLLFTFWFFAPAGAANVGAFFSAKIPLIRHFTYPVDCFMKIRGKRVLGGHKTIRGFIVGTLVSIAIVYLQMWLMQQFSWLRTLIHIDYTAINPLLFGFLSGFGALTGDALKSFFKRQRKIQPGSGWFPFDQIDYIIGGIVFTAFYIRLNLSEYIVLFLLWFLIHPFMSFLGYFFRLRKEPI